MSKDSFNKLNTLEQIKYINSNLSENKSLTIICKELGISRSTIRDRFQKSSYSYSKESNQYIKNNSYITSDIQPNKKNGTNNNSVTPVIQDDIADVISRTDNEVKAVLLDLVDNYTFLKEIIELHKHNTNVIKEQIVINLKNSESRLTTIRVNAIEFDLFNKFCDNNKQYKKIDLLSQALKEFREKYQ